MNCNILKRLFMYIAGLFVMTIGIALSVKSDLGVSPVSSIPYTMTCIWGIEMGKATILLHCFLVLLQIALLRKNYKLKNLLQIIVGIMFGYFTTFCNWGAGFLPDPQNMIIRICMVLLSTIIIALGIFLYLPPDIMPLAGEGAAQAVSEVSGIAFPKVKIGFDISMVTVSLITCLILIKNFGSVGIGTVIAAVLVGTELGFLSNRFGHLRDQWLGENIEQQTNDESIDTNHYIVTISREYGSGGREIGKKLAGNLGIKYYDLDIIRKAADESEISETIVEKNEQSVKYPTARSIYYWYTQSTSEKELPIVEKIYHAQEKIIREIAQNESCVIIGRLANFILRDRYPIVSLFIGAEMNAKIKRVVLLENLNEEQAKAKIQKVEKERANHCLYFTHEQWDNVNNYDFYIKSDIFGIDHTAALATQIVKEKLGL